MPEFPGYEVNLPDVTSWIIREMHLHGPVPEEVVLNLKLDGRPFCGELVIKLNYYANVFYLFPQKLIKVACTNFFLVHQF